MAYSPKNPCPSGCSRLILVASGNRGLSFFSMLRSEIIAACGVCLIGVVGLDEGMETSKLLKQAREEGISVLRDIDEIRHVNPLDMVMVLEDSSSLLEKIISVIPEHVGIIDSRMANLIHCLYQTDEKGSQAEEKFYSVFRSARDAIIILDNKLNIHQVNPVAASMFGYGPEELVSKNIQELIPPDQHMFYSRVEEGRGEPVIVEAVKQDGKIFPVRASVASFYLSNQLFYTVILRDQTKRREMEERLLQAERLAAVGQTASYLIHEIKNPLIVIGGFAQQLLKKASDKDRDKLQMIVKEIERLETLVSDVRDFTKPIDLEKQETDINELISDTVALFKEEASKYGIEITISLDESIPKLMLDKNLIKQVLINLVKNAIEAIKEQGELTISSRLENNVVKIEISDTGCGIPQENLKEIFNPFFTTKKKGTGLGLTISYRIIKDHGGIIKIKSNLNMGTDCIILLPIK